MSLRLLIDVEVLELTKTLPHREQEALWRRFREIGERPTRFSDYIEPDATGRNLDIHVYRGFAIHFWNDGADRHVKILHLCRADES